MPKPIKNTGLDTDIKSVTVDSLTHYENIGYNVGVGTKILLPHMRTQWQTFWEDYSCSILHLHHKNLINLLYLGRSKSSITCSDKDNMLMFLSDNSIIRTKMDAEQKTVTSFFSITFYFIKMFYEILLDNISGNKPVHKFNT